MSRGDGTGPRGIGTLTGRGAGSCTGGQGRGRKQSGPGRGAGGRGLCGWFSASELAGRTPQENEERLMKEQIESLLKQQEEVHRRLSELGK